jgi:hypothetical protein
MKYLIKKNIRNLIQSLRNQNQKDRVKVVSNQKFFLGQHCEQMKILMIMDVQLKLQQ